MAFNKQNGFLGPFFIERYFGFGRGAFGCFIFRDIFQNIKPEAGQKFPRLNFISGAFIQIAVKDFRYAVTRRKFFKIFTRNIKSAQLLILRNGIDIFGIQRCLCGHDQIVRIENNIDRAVILTLGSNGQRVHGLRVDKKRLSFVNQIGIIADAVFAAAFRHVDKLRFLMPVEGDDL